MSVTVDKFIQKYSNAISEGYAAIFAGAGLSKPSGYVCWRELLRPLAETIGLEIDKEHDLLSVAQYYYNQQGTRNDVNQAILNEFTKGTSFNENVEILTRLPISTYWTTNYDELIEDGLKNSNRKPDIKISEDSLATNIYDRDAVVYKMHGDVRDPSKAIIIKDDYETYGITHSLFTTALKGDLISKTFLFIGFSFEDPNLNCILGRIKALLGTSVRTHYCFFEKVHDNGDSEEFVYNKTKQELIMSDLSRYGIQAVMLEEYSQIPEILKAIEVRCNLNNVFISASLATPDGGWTDKSATDFAHKLSKTLVQHDFKITSGFGLGIGSAVINGALEEIMASKFKHIDEHLRLRPFPQFVSGDNTSLDDIWCRYRIDMIGDCGVALFMFGNKNVNGNVVIANGMLKEYQIAKNAGKKIIPVGSTGGAARQIFDEVKENIGEFPYLVPYIGALEIEIDLDKLVNLIISIVDKIRGR
jgi:hypothetical protein